MGVKVEIDPVQTILMKRGLNKGGRAQQFIDSESLKMCDPYIPKDTGMLIDSGTMNSQIGSGKIIWSTPYARRWYYKPAHFQDAPQRGNYWFDRMLREGGRKKLVDGVAALVGGRSSL